MVRMRESGTLDRSFGRESRQTPGTGKDNDEYGFHHAPPLHVQVEFLETAPVVSVGRFTEIETGNAHDIQRNRRSAAPRLLKSVSQDRSGIFFRNIDRSQRRLVAAAPKLSGSGNQGPGRIAVTGGNLEIGSHIADELVGEGAGVGVQPAAGEDTGEVIEYKNRFRVADATHTSHRDGHHGKFVVPAGCSRCQMPRPLESADDQSGSKSQNGRDDRVSEQCFHREVL